MIAAMALLIASTGVAAARSPNVVKTLAPAGAIKTTGTWALGTRAGDFVYIAGMRGIDPKTNALVQGDEARIRQGFLNMQMIAESEGGEPARLRAHRRLCDRHVSISAAGEQGPGGALGQWPLSAAHHRGGPPPQSGRYIRGRRHLLRTGEKVTAAARWGLGLAGSLRYI